MLREFGSELFRGPKQISFYKISNLLGTSEEALNESLTILDNLGIISYHPSIEKETILLTVPRLEKERLQLNYKKINEAYLNSKQKLNKMIDYVTDKPRKFGTLIERDALFAINKDAQSAFAFVSGQNDIGDFKTAL